MQELSLELLLTTFDNQLPEQNIKTTFHLKPVLTTLLVNQAVLL